MDIPLYGRVIEVRECALDDSSDVEAKIVVRLTGKGISGEGCFVLRHPANKQLAHRVGDAFDTRLVGPIGEE